MNGRPYNMINPLNEEDKRLETERKANDGDAEAQLDLADYN